LVCIFDEHQDLAGALCRRVDVLCLARLVSRPIPAEKHRLGGRVLEMSYERAHLEDLGGGAFVDVFGGPALPKLFPILAFFQLGQVELGLERRILVVQEEVLESETSENNQSTSGNEVLTLQTTVPSDLIWRTWSEC
jgi:hypothetical protein